MLNHILKTLAMSTGMIIAGVVCVGGYMKIAPIVESAWSNRKQKGTETDPDGNLFDFEDVDFEEVEETKEASNVNEDAEEEEEIEDLEEEDSEESVDEVIEEDNIIQRILSERILSENENLSNEEAEKIAEDYRKIYKIFYDKEINKSKKIYILDLLRNGSLGALSFILGNCAHGFLTYYETPVYLNLLKAGIRCPVLHSVTFTVAELAVIGVTGYIIFRFIRNILMSQYDYKNRRSAADMWISESAKAYIRDKYNVCIF